MYFQRLFPSSPVKSSNSPPSNRSTAPKSTPLENNTSMSSDSQGGILNCTTHVDIDSLIEEYVWQRFKDLLTIKGSGLETFKNLEIGDAEFEINRKKLFLVHSQPNYNNIQLTGTRPNTICK